MNEKIRNYERVQTVARRRLLSNPHCPVHLNLHIIKLLKYSYSLYSYEQAEIVYFYSDKEKMRW